MTPRLWADPPTEPAAAPGSAVTPGPSTPAPQPIHSTGCWRRHHLCAVNRIEALAAVLTDALAAYDTVVPADAADEFSATVTAGRLDGWHRVLAGGTAVAGADVTPDPAAPATTT